MDILNSPVVVLIAVLTIAAVIFYRKTTGLDRRCSVCTEGKLEEISAKPEKTVGGTSADTTSTSWVVYTVQYKCTHCDNTLERTENRR